MTLLDELYDGALCPKENWNGNDMEAEISNTIIEKLQKNLDAKLDAEDRRMFSQLLTVQSELQSTQARKRFVQGFRLGVGLIVEGLPRSMQE